MQFSDRKSLKKCDEQFTPSTSFNAFRSVVRQRQAADGVNHAVQESSESCAVLVTRESRGVQNRFEGRIERMVKGKCLFR